LEKRLRLSFQPRCHRHLPLNGLPNSGKNLTLAANYINLVMAEKLKENERSSKNMLTDELQMFKFDEKYLIYQKSCIILTSNT
jgi:hypothetical protein